MQSRFVGLRLLAAVVAIALFGETIEQPSAHVALAPPPRVTSGPLRDTRSWGNEFGLTHIVNFVPSEYSYEASLLGGQRPVADSDYILPYGWSEPVHLPGHSWDHYAPDGSYDVIGSGWANEFTAPNGGRFALLHMRGGFLAAGLPMLAVIASPPPHAPTITDDETGYVLGRQATTIVSRVPPMPGARYILGGSYVSYSGWPTYPQYANGYPGPGDAHLCLVLSQKAAQYFHNLHVGIDHFKPKKTSKHRR